MKLAKIVIGEMLLLAASVLIFRSIWTLLDQYFGTSNLLPVLIIGIVAAIIGLVIINHEVECKIREARRTISD
jgi:uncharacterized integral membrane protein